MNDTASTVRVREGFVEAKPEPEKPKAPALPHPAPEIEPSPAEVAPPPEDRWPIVCKLSFKKIQNDAGDTIDQLSFREPRGGDINRYGNPVRMNAQGDWVIEERKMHYVMGALSGVQPPLLDAMDPRDWNFCAYELMRFFLPTRRV